MQPTAGRVAAGKTVKNILLTAAALFCVYSFMFPPAVRPSGPVADALSNASYSDRREVARIYRSLADVVKRDGGQKITTTVVWRAIYKDALSLAAGGTALPGKYKGLDLAIEEVLSKYYSLDSAPLTEELSKKIADACLEVARQSGG
jgi:hypothetical protein